MTLPDPADAAARFRTVFDRQPSLQLFAPGRINLIGEHIDYCGGLVMPMAINAGTLCTFAPNDSSLVRIRSDNADESTSFRVDALPQSPCGDWIDYAIGIAGRLSVDRGADIHVIGNISSGGLSSSASFTAAIGAALAEVNGKRLDSDAARVELARECRAAENEFVGVACGVMDPMAVALGGILELDCARLDYRRLNWQRDDVAWIVMDTGEPRTLAASAYNRRVRELELACAALADPPPLAELCTRIDASGLDDFVGPDDVSYRRLRHVVTEQARVKQATVALEAGDAAALGALMVASHASLRDDYEVTGEALDTIVAASLEQEGTIGARMTGAGFGGCAIALVKREHAGAHNARVADVMASRRGSRPRIDEVEPHPGVGTLAPQLR